MRSSETDRGESRARLQGRFARWLRAAASVGVLGSAVISSSAFAGTKFLTVDVVPLSTQTSYSSVNGATNAAFRATVTNNTTSDVNNAWFRVHTTLNGGPGPLFAGKPAQCSIDNQIQPVGSGLVCQVTLLFAVPAPSVALTFVVPAPTAPDGGASSQLVLEWSVQAGQGKGNGNPSNVVQNDSKPITLVVGSADALSSYVLANTNLKVVFDSSNTGVTPPKDAPVDLKQNGNPSSCSSNFLPTKCYTTTLSIVDPVTGLVTFEQTNPLVIDLVRDASTINTALIPPPSINNLNGALMYSPDGVAFTAIGPCDGTDPAFTIPTGADRCYIPANASPPANAFTYVDNLGNWHIRVLAKTNGIINW